MSNMQKPPALVGQVEPSVGRHPWAAEMLAMMSDRWGTTTGDLAQRHSRLQHCGANRHQQSASALAVLRQLEAQGVVKKLDNEKPIAWVLVTPNAG